jgi:hypothetical protein
MKLRVIRILVAALLAQLLGIVLLMLIVGPLVRASDPPTFQAAERLVRLTVVWAAPLSALVTCLLGGWWAARRLDADQVRHGLLAGVGTAVLDVGWLVLLGAPLQAVFVVAEIVRVGAGAAGGWLAGRRRARRARSAGAAGYSGSSPAVPSGTT